MVVQHSDSGEPIGPMLLRSTWKAGVSTVVADATELALDSILDEGVLRDVPIIGWAAKGYGVVSTVRDRLFLKKVLHFLHGAGDVSDEDKADFGRRIGADPAVERRVGETLALILERHEHFDKSYMTGKVFAGYMDGKIDYPTFLKLSTAIDRAFIEDLRQLHHYYNDLSSISDGTGQSLHLCGLVGQHLILHDLKAATSGQSAGSVTPRYVHNDLGTTLLQLLETHTT